MCAPEDVHMHINKRTHTFAHMHVYVLLRVHLWVGGWVGVHVYTHKANINTNVFSVWPLGALFRVPELN